MAIVPEWAKITKGLGKLTPDVMARIGEATESTLSTISTADHRGLSLNRERPKWMRVISSTVIKQISEQNAVWLYNIKPAAFTVSANTYTSPAAQTVNDGSSTTTLYAVNLLEWGTDATTITPGVPWADIPIGFALQPISANTVILCFPIKVCVGTIPPSGEVLATWGFTVPNAYSGECSAVPPSPDINGGTY